MNVDGIPVSSTCDTAILATCRDVEAQVEAANSQIESLQDNLLRHIRLLEYQVRQQVIYLSGIAETRHSKCNWQIEHVGNMLGMLPGAAEPHSLLDMGQSTRLQGLQGASDDSDSLSPSSSTDVVLLQEPQLSMKSNKDCNTPTSAERQETLRYTRETTG